LQPPPWVSGLELLPPHAATATDAATKEASHRDERIEVARAYATPAPARPATNLARRRAPVHARLCQRRASASESAPDRRGALGSLKVRIRSCEDTGPSIATGAFDACTGTNGRWRTGITSARLHRWRMRRRAGCHGVRRELSLVWSRLLARPDLLRQGWQRHVQRRSQGNMQRWRVDMRTRRCARKRVFRGRRDRSAVRSRHERLGRG
jgi:hypothetical protein